MPSILCLYNTTTDSNAHWLDCWLTWLLARNLPISRLMGHEGFGLRRGIHLIAQHLPTKSSSQFSMFVIICEIIQIRGWDSNEFILQSFKGKAWSCCSYVTLQPNQNPYAKMLLLVSSLNDHCHRSCRQTRMLRIGALTSLSEIVYRGRFDPTGMNRRWSLKRAVPERISTNFFWSNFWQCSFWPPR